MSSNFSQEGFDASLKRAMDHELKFGPLKRAADGVVEIANLIAHNAKDGRTAFMLSDVASLEERIGLLKATITAQEK